MNSRGAILLLIVVLAAVLCQQSDAFTAGAGNIKKRDFSEAARHLSHICEAAKKSCSMLNMKRTVDNTRIDELEDEVRQHGED
ncbi:hypothetical protein OS493_005055 [Desmophyllum pertusum]|uniref:Uncharacterized protein n=1 Tax=Desmophyllum pertusum TaxID=174260 RepID=A0A9X0CT99_9CNID|nr:hypothetical protein OS493_005055 [Desmophyllum pertusum]